MDTEIDQLFMQQALKLAKKAYGFVSPNPYVGALIVKNGQIIGQGWHKKAGEAHAEVNAINDALTQVSDIKGATLYVTLEPCCHFGKTPPCSDLVIQSGISRVVIAMEDPNPLVQGKGIQCLQAAGLSVTVGVLENEAEHLNRIFLHNQRVYRPFIAIKSAISLDGKCATRNYDSKWISNEEARRYAHFLRQGFDAILIGQGTLNRDNPQLTIRHPDFSNTSKKLIRLILCTEPYLLDLKAEIFNTNLAPTWLMLPETFEDTLLVSKLQALGVEVYRCPMIYGKIEPMAVLSLLKTHCIQSVLVEGGPQIYSAFFQAQLVDWLYLFQAPILIGSHDAPSLWDNDGVSTMDERVQITSLHRQSLGDNQLIEGRPLFSK